MVNTVKVMGILNVTPDSFSDGGRYASVDSAVQRGLEMVAEGADIIDIGGESTRPYAKPVSLQEECDRVIPVLEKLRERTPVTLSVDTSKPELIRAAIAAGADMVNDIRALTLPGALEAVAESASVSICLAHTPAEPSSMQDNPYYENVAGEVYAFLDKRISACLTADIAKDRLIIDPGIGFGKTTRHNFQLLHELALFQGLGAPILVGVSRKACIGALLNQPISERLYGSLAAAVLAVSKGAQIIRSHDVKPTVDALTVAAAILMYS